MSTDFRLVKEVSFKEVFDGRLEPFGIREEYIIGSTSRNSRALTDGRDHLWVYGKETVQILTRYGRNCPNYILEVIAKIFNTNLWSEHDPQFWGFETQKEMDAHEMAAVAHTRKLRYEKLLTIAKDRNADPTERESTIAQAAIAKELMEESPHLADPGRMDEFLMEVDNRYKKEIQSPLVTEGGLLQALIGGLRGEGEHVSDELSEMFEELEHKSF